MLNDDAVCRLVRRPDGGGDTNPCAGWVAPKSEGLGRACKARILSYSSARRSVSRRSFSERDGGRGMGGLESGSCVAMDGGEDGLERDRDGRDVIFVVLLCVDRMGEGAWICMDMAKVGVPGGGISALAMYE